MESINVVFNAARDGNISKLKSFLDNKPKDKVVSLVSSLTNGTTPLVIACRNGHLNVVEYLIDECYADIEQFGNVQFDGEPTVESAPPLWCAAAIGHFGVVKLLVKNKASINCTTKTNSTPLRAACFGGFFKIVEYLILQGADTEITNHKGHTSLMIACYKGHSEISEYLIRNGADVNKKSFNGDTALHDCAESGDLETFKLLLEYGAKYECNSSGITPSVSAALCGHVAIVEYLFNEFGCTKLDKVNALEVLGATFIDRNRDTVKGSDFWQRALKLRNEDSDNLLLKPITQFPVASYINASEFRTISELEEIRHNLDEMSKQVILVRERILGPSHDDTIFSIKMTGAVYADGGNFDICVQLWLYTLDVEQKERIPLSLLIQSTFSYFGNLFSYMITEAWAFGREVELPFRNTVDVFERAVKEIQRAMKLSGKEGQDSNFRQDFNKFLMFTTHFIGIMCFLKPLLSESEELELKKSIYKLVQINPRAKNGGTLLHLACSEIPYSFDRQVMPFPSREVVDLLLEVGACPNAVDADNNTPLHIAAMNKEFAPAVFKSFLKHGAHLDVCNHEKQTPLQLARAIPLYDIYPLQHINLQCLCAQAIQINNISYKEFVHKELEVFLDVHGT